MGKYCCVIGCTSKSARGRIDDVRAVSFLMFPKDWKLRGKWKNAVPRDNSFSVSDNTFVCSLHVVLLLALRTHLDEGS